MAGVPNRPSPDSSHIPTTSASLALEWCLSVASEEGAAQQELSGRTLEVEGLSRKLSNRMSLSMCSARGSCSWSWENSISKTAGGDTSSSKNIMFSACGRRIMPDMSSGPDDYYTF